GEISLRAFLLPGELLPSPTGLISGRLWKNHTVLSTGSEARKSRLSMCSTGRAACEVESNVRADRSNRAATNVFQNACPGRPGTVRRPPQRIKETWRPCAGDGVPSL